MSQRSQKARFVHGIEPIHIQRRFGLCVTQALRIFENPLKITPLLLHASQDVIASSVEDPIEVVDTVPHQPFT